MEAEIRSVTPDVTSEVGTWRVQAPGEVREV